MAAGRKGAVVMLLIVALWAAIPALACFASAPCHPCCRAGHMMQMDCGAATMSAGHSCCDLNSPSTPAPSEQTATTSMASAAMQPLASVSYFVPFGLAGQELRPTAAPPPRSLLGSSTILRI